MSIDSESSQEANLQIGPTTLGMVRIFVESGGHEVIMDFSPDEANEIAEEICAAAVAVSRSSGKGKTGGKPGKK